MAVISHSALLTVKAEQTVKRQSLNLSTLTLPRSSTRLEPSNEVHGDWKSCAVMSQMMSMRLMYRAGSGWAPGQPGRQGY